jgi:CheY-like chemotaxis protein
MSEVEKQLKILIVEDEPDLREVIQCFFENYGWQVGLAANGKQAVDAMQATKYDVVLSDIRMPVATGVDMLKKLPPELKKDTSIIMMSGFTAHSERAVQELGASKLLAKPVTAKTLMREVNIFKWQKKAASEPVKKN